MVADRQSKLAFISRAQRFLFAAALASSMRHDSAPHRATEALILARSTERSPRQPLVAAQVEENRSKRA